jgi:stage II sporulation protein P
MTVAHGSDTPQILLFHTHSQEGFADSVEGDDTTTILGIGDYLAKILTEKYGYNVIHDRSIYDYVDGKLDRSKAYTYAENGIAAILKENPDIDVVIDLHRDGVAESTRLVTQIDGKQMAKVMLFNGISYSNAVGNISYLSNPYRDDNLAMSLQLQLLGEAYYPGFLRNIYINAYRYCLNQRAKSMLIEAGAQTNTFEEVKNSMEPLADLLDKLLRGEKAY